MCEKLANRPGKKVEYINMPKQNDWQKIFNKCSNHLAKENIRKAVDHVDLGIVLPAPLLQSTLLPLFKNWRMAFCQN